MSRFFWTLTTITPPGYNVEMYLIMTDVCSNLHWEGNIMWSFRLFQQYKYNARPTQTSHCWWLPFSRWGHPSVRLWPLLCVNWGGPAIQPYEIDNSLAGQIPLLPLPITARSFHKVPTLIAFCRSQWKKKRKNLKEEKRKNSIVGSLHSFSGLCIANNKLQTSPGRKRHKWSKALEDWPTGL